MHNLYLMTQDSGTGQFYIKAIIDKYQSFIWAERYAAYGDFELRIDIPMVGGHNIKLDDYIRFEKSKYTMVVEDIEILRSAKESYAKITGRSIESFLDRRIIDTDFTAYNAPIAVMTGHVRDQFTPGAPVASKRVPGFSVNFGVPPGHIPQTRNPYTFKGKDLYTAVTTIAQDTDLGFRIDLDIANGGFRFTPFRGADRAFTDIAAWSVEIGNLKQISHVNTARTYKNAALIDFAPGDKNSDKRYVNYPAPSSRVGLARREILVDASSIKAKGYEDAVMQDVANALAYSDLKQAQGTFAFDAKIDENRKPFYGVDYNIGDIVLFHNDFDLRVRYRVTEYIRSYSPSGVQEYPTFEIERVE